MIVDYATSRDVELLGVVPWLAPAIAAATTVGTAIAGGVIAKRGQRRATKAQSDARAHELRIAELQRQQRELEAARKAKQRKTMLMIGVPAAVGAAALLMGE